MTSRCVGVDKNGRGCGGCGSYAVNEKSELDSKTPLCDKCVWKEKYLILKGQSKPALEGLKERETPKY